MSKSLSPKVQLVDVTRFESIISSTDLPVAIHFHTDGVLASMNFSAVFDRMAADWSGDIKFLRVDRNRSRELAEKLGIQSSPTLLFYKDGKEVCSRLSGYIEISDVQEAINAVVEKTCLESPTHSISCDVLILGAGPAGLTAALYASRSRLNTVVLEASVPGGQVGTTFQIANYPGVNGVVRGSDLMENMKNQAQSFGAVIYDLARPLKLSLSGVEKRAEANSLDIKARAVIIATGAEPRKLPIVQEKQYRSRGIHYCATCDGALYQDADVMVIGGGLSALEEAEFITRYAKKVTLINRADVFRAPKGIVDHVLGISGIEVKYRTQVIGVSGEVFVSSATLKNLDNGQIEDVPVDGIFVYIGNEPDTKMFGSELSLSPGGFILAGEDTKTSIAGVFAAGDIREKSIRQITTAVSDGTIAAVMAERYLSE